MPDGQHLEYLGKTIRHEREEDQTYRLRDQVAVVAYLLSGFDDEIKLPLPAVLICFVGFRRNGNGGDIKNKRPGCVPGIIFGGFIYLGLMLGFAS